MVKTTTTEGAETNTGVTEFALVNQIEENRVLRVRSPCPPYLL
jgi:hypothetical protein